MYNSYNNDQFYSERVGAPIGCIGKWALIKFKGTSTSPGYVWPMLVENVNIANGTTTGRIPPHMNMQIFPNDSIEDSICL
ncbi:hypothetical protein ACTFRV_27415 [Bacillus cereus group sp. MYBK185-1]|uniref:hypothetical protein n=1 Tax=Bacillus cereus group sp. MYBK185-1 TaxID=3450672 RepID=UPI003F7B287F